MLLKIIQGNSMSYNDLRKGRVSITDQEYFITFNTLNRNPIFTDYQTASVAVKALLDLNEDQWLSWVLMPDHFHGLLRLNDASLSDTVRRCKSKSTVLINKHLNQSGPIWQSTFYDRALREEEDRVQVARYIVANPLRAGLVDCVGDYPYWDSVWLK